MKFYNSRDKMQRRAHHLSQQQDVQYVWPRRRRGCCWQSCADSTRQPQLRIPIMFTSASMSYREADNRRVFSRYDEIVKWAGKYAWLYSFIFTVSLSMKGFDLSWVHSWFVPCSIFETIFKKSALNSRYFDWNLECWTLIKSTTLSRIFAISSSFFRHASDHISAV